MIDRINGTAATTTKPANDRHILAYLKTVLAQLGLEGTNHKSRHSFCTIAVLAGVDFFTKLRGQPSPLGVLARLAVLRSCRRRRKGVRHDAPPPSDLSRLRDEPKKVSKRKLRTGKSEYAWNDQDKIQTRESPHLRMVSDHLCYKANEVVDKRRVFKKPVRGAGHPLRGTIRAGRWRPNSRSSTKRKRNSCVASSG